ncbi:Concanavalin A-like lectin/glucanases superfamily [uncultured Caudovirales phage]|uniref:Concanavalin A-like lectin/glucanases superfamily n=1 Tax=uncultured Caudovirales phage TaxID=2100421 RepID=A0A6J5NKQ5_9CAUD|nr:Concanavalin A-like lectin/glucanases superfamily [uncultured Caudovirales phage]
MAFNYSPRINTEGLILYLDAANTRSYPGTGTTWTDLSRSGNNATLINGPTFSSANGGSIVFDGSNDYVKPTSLSTLQLTNFTLSSWIKTNTQNVNQFIIDTSTSTNFGYGYSYRINSANKIRFWAYDANNFLDSTSTVFSNIWYNIVVTYNNISKLQTIYINGVFDISNTHTNTFIVSDVINLQIGGSLVLSGYLNGNITQTSIYNRVLSAVEIQQNYNATKTRFRL